MADRNDPPRLRKRRKKDTDDIDSQDEADRVKSRATMYRGVVKELGPNINSLMWLFGDSEPTTDSVAVMADIVLELITNLCSLPPTPYPAPPAYHPIPPKQIPIPSINALRRTLGKSPLHSRKYAHLQHHIVTSRLNKAARKVTKDVDRPNALAFGGLGENLAELVAMADEGGGAGGGGGESTRGRGAARGGAKGGRGAGKGWRGKGATGGG